MPSSPAIKTRRFLLVKPVAASSVWHRAPARAWTRGSPNRRAGVLRPSASAEGCATRSKAGLARTVPWPARSVSSMRRLAARALAWSSSRLGRRALQPRSTGGVDDGLDPHRLPVFQVLLDPRVLVEHIHQDTAVAAAVDRGAEDARGVAADLAGEDDLHVVRPADVQ